MDEYTKEAIELVKIKASQVPMEHDAITAMVKNIAQGLREADGQGVPAEQPIASPALDPKKAVKENSVVCLICGRSMKVLTAKHLKNHGVTPAEYRQQFGYKKTQPLACKALSRERRKKMASMELWKRRGKPQTEVQQ